MPKITADIPEELYRFLRGRIVDQRLEGEPTTVSTLVTGLLDKWKNGGLALVNVADREQEQVISPPIPTAARAAKASPFETTGEWVDRRIADAGFSKVEEEQVAAKIKKITDELVELAVMLRKE